MDVNAIPHLPHRSEAHETKRRPTKQIVPLLTPISCTPSAVPAASSSATGANANEPIVLDLDDDDEEDEKMESSPQALTPAKRKQPPVEASTASVALLSPSASSSSVTNHVLFTPSKSDWGKQLLDGVDPAVRNSPARFTSPSPTNASVDASSNEYARKRSKLSATKPPIPPSAMMSIASLSSLAAARSASTGGIKQTLSKREEAPSSQQSPSQTRAAATSSPTAAVATPAAAPRWTPTHPVFHRIRAYQRKSDWLKAIMKLRYFNEFAQQYNFVFEKVIEIHSIETSLRQAKSAVAIGEGTPNEPCIIDDLQPGSRQCKNSGRGLEVYISLLLKLAGWTDVSVKAGPTDGGIDVIAQRTNPETGQLEQAAVQSKHYESQGDLSMDCVGTWHSSLIRLPFFNMQKRSSPSSDSSTPPLVPDASLIKQAFLITTATFSGQTRKFVAALNQHQREAVEHRRVIQESIKDEQPKLWKKLNDCWSKDFLGEIILLDGAEFEQWIIQIVNNHADGEFALEREEVQLAIESVNRHSARCGMIVDLPMELNHDPRLDSLYRFVSSDEMKSAIWRSAHTDEPGTKQQPYWCKRMQQLYPYPWQAMPQPGQEFQPVER